MKICTKCLEQKPFELFYKRKASKDGLSHKCIACDKKYNQENKQKRSISKKKYREAHKEKIYEYMKEYRKNNKEQIKEKEKEYSIKNKERELKVQMQYRVKNKEKINENRKKYMEANREKVLATQKRYREKNKALRASLERKRQASKIRRTPTWLTEFDKLKIKCLYQVAAMRTIESGEKWHVDHIVPMQGKLVSGLHVPYNMRVIPAKENCRKHNRFEIN